ncbi:hypothetical protein ACQY0O_001573 [Thecaphora frezii]
MPDASCAPASMGSVAATGMAVPLIGNGRTLLSVSCPCEILDPKDGSVRLGTVLSVRHRSGAAASHPGGHAAESPVYYVHIDGEDKRLDGWIDAHRVRPRSGGQATVAAAANGNGKLTTTAGLAGKRRRPVTDEADGSSDGIQTPPIHGRVASPSAGPLVTSIAAASAEASRPTQRPASSEATAPRNIDKVFYGAYEIRTWYHSPYPLEEDHPDDHVSPRPGSTSGSSRRSAAAASPLGGKTGSANGNKRTKRDRTSLGRDTPPVDAAASAHVHHPGGALGGSAKEMPALRAILDEKDQTSNAGAGAFAMARTASADGSLRKAHLHGGASFASRNLWICEGCFKYMKTYSGYAFHKKQCDYRHPPGRKVYQRGGHIIWEVDGAEAKLYAQNLSLFGKLFIDHKTIYFDVSPFLFYVLTEAGSSSFDHAIGFFSKEKQSYDDYNLACIITFPPFQRKSFGTLMIEFSYALSARQGMLGTPERPLSDLGLKGYVSFWSAVVLRTLRVALGDDSSSGGGGSDNGEATPISTPTTGGGGDFESRQRARRKLQTLETRCKLLGLDAEAIEQEGLAALRLACQPSGEQSTEEERKRRRAAKGFAGSPLSTHGERRNLTVRLRLSSRNPATALTPSSAAVAADGGGVENAEDGSGSPTPASSSIRTLRRRSSLPRPPASPVPLTHQPHPRPQRETPAHPSLLLESLDGEVTLETTLDLLASTTHLRPEDIAVALAECHLLSLRTASSPSSPTSCSATGTATVTPTILLTRSAIDEAIASRKVRPCVLDESCLLL